MDQTKRDAINAKNREKYARRTPEQIAADKLKNQQRRAAVSEENKAAQLLKKRQQYADASDQEKTEKVAKQQERRAAVSPQQHAASLQKRKQTDATNNNNLKQARLQTQETNKLAVSDCLDESTKRDAINAKNREKYARRTPEQIAADKLKNQQRRAAVSEENKAAQLLKKRQQYADASDQEKTEKVAKQKERRAAVSPQQHAASLQKRKQTDATNNNNLQQARLHTKQTNKLAVSDCFDESSVIQHDCGPLDNKKCPDCGALHFEKESNLFCCSHGKIHTVGEPKPGDDPDVQYGIIKPRTTPTIITDLLKSKSALENIRSINSSISFGSCGMKLTTFTTKGKPCFKAHGQVYHCSGPLHHKENEAPQFAQLYFYDSTEANEFRMQHVANKGCDPNMLIKLDQFIRNENPLAKSYNMLKEVEAEAIRNNEDTRHIMMSISTEKKDLDYRRYNAARSNDIAAVFSSKEGEPPFNRDIKVYLRSENRTQQICILNKFLDAMLYPIFFPYGETQWHDKIHTRKREKRMRISQMEFYSYIFQIRDQVNVLLNAGKLTLQYICDAYCRMEANRLQYLRQNQASLRADKYVNILDQLCTADEFENEKVGRKVILPSSFTGSPRNMNQHYQDAMAIVRENGRPTLFITATCNPNWPEIQDNLYDGQTWSDRPDLVARIFKLKAKELIEDLLKNEIFGETIGLVYVIEFQKRGLPHMHILLILKHDKYNDPDEIDKAISAEVPDPAKNPVLHERVAQFMTHGPCNTKSACWKNGGCSKKYPKGESEVTCLQDGFPKYRRRQNGHTATRGERIITNCDVVPYNAYLIMKFNCHINVEACTTIKSVKYVYKYVYKGHDRADIKLSANKERELDEIDEHVNSRYVSAPEAMWRIFAFEMQYQSHTIYRLNVHLPGHQTVTFTEGNLDKALENAVNKDTTLTAFFKLNRRVNDSCHPEDDTYYFYTELPKYYSFDKSTRKWKKRVRDVGSQYVIGRMYSVLAADPERYALRHLLLRTKGATSFEDLRTVDGVVCDTFKEACIRLGIYEDDSEWDLALTEANDDQSAYKIRQLFALILTHGEPQSPIKLWEKHKCNMIEDFVFKHVLNNDDIVNTNVVELAESLALKEIKNILKLCRKKLEDYQLPLPNMTLINALPTQDQVIHVYESYDPVTELNQFNVYKPLLNIQQMEFVERIILSVEDPVVQSKCFMVDGPAGSGKTFVYKTLMSYIRGNKINDQQGLVLPVASTGIAATLLAGGRTAHSQFGIPINCDQDSTSFLTSQSNDWNRIKNCNLIIWDECTMTHKHSLEVVDKLLRDIMELPDVPFGGKVFVLGGDFRQCLPIVPHGNDVAIIESTVCKSGLWKYFTTCKLTANMRASGDSEFAKWLTDVWEGSIHEKVNEVKDVVCIPVVNIVTENLVDEIFGGITSDCISTFCNRAILCPLNEDTFVINAKVLTLLEGDEVEYKSADSVVLESPADEGNFQVEYLNTITPSGMAPHLLKLKKGCIVMLLRNINTKLGLCNGTRLIVKDLKPNLVIAEVITGPSVSKTVFIPRISTTSNETEYPFILKRRQFPLRLAFAMTINKSQGQSLEKVGLFLSKPVFGHGQLYVALSRATARNNVKVQVVHSEKQGKLAGDDLDTYTFNCVYKNVLT